MLAQVFETASTAEYLLYQHYPVFGCFSLGAIYVVSHK